MLIRLLKNNIDHYGTALGLVTGQSNWYCHVAITSYDYNVVLNS